MHSRPQYVIFEVSEDLIPMNEKRRLTDAEIAEIRRRRPGVRASLACEGMVLTAEEEALFDQMEQQRLTPDERAAHITAFSRAARRQKAPAST
jgi:hypothetical protein